ncbi:hypothetical protein CkaCkLH20_06039 [Colletotrichum karsti]|uniref:Ecp2 effector protein domain-containing protein n=1 Tax=Colletotrichum karsti TaxID=1095194 RepID=A0A9P6LKX3_9PEZI|nr:uncharacterized protein CkaCkLH20_06039 [Colletotrichum karsti]KAF9876631.1 hypothetical protein CkaCkLH20_06039 [Colletotrichum karsti]
MVNFALPALATLALTPLIGAFPTNGTFHSPSFHHKTARSNVVEAFSFSKWVDGLITNPDGDNLTPEEAVEAWRASINGTHAAHVDKRVMCNTIAGTEAYVPDAVSCINQLAARGSEACTVATVTAFCVIGNAQITGVKGGTNDQSTTSSCNDVARGAGAVMDSCTRADNMVQGAEFAYGNGNLLVHIRSPGL